MGGAWSTSPSPDSKVVAERVGTVSFSALGWGSDSSFLAHRSTSGSVPGSLTSVCEAVGVGSRYESGSSGSPTGKGVGKEKPDEAWVGTSVRMAVASSSSSVRVNSVKISEGVESGSRGGIMRGVTWSTSPPLGLLSAMVTGATAASLGATVEASSGIWVTTMTSSSTLAFSCLSVTTCRGEAVGGAAVVGGDAVVAGVVGSGALLVVVAALAGRAAAVAGTVVVVVGS